MVNDGNIRRGLSTDVCAQAYTHGCDARLAALHLARDICHVLSMTLAPAGASLVRPRMNHHARESSSSDDLAAARAVGWVDD